MSCVSSVRAVIFAGKHEEVFLTACGSFVDKYDSDTLQWLARVKVCRDGSAISALFLLGHFHVLAAAGTRCHLINISQRPMRVVQSIDSNESIVRAAALSPDRRRLLLGLLSNNTVAHYSSPELEPHQESSSNEDSGKLLSLVKCDAGAVAATAMAFQPGAPVCVTGTSMGHLIIWDTCSGTVLASNSEASQGVIWALALSQQERRLLICLGSDDRTVRLWAFDQPSQASSKGTISPLLYSLCSPIREHRGRIWSCCFCPPKVDPAGAAGRRGISQLAVCSSADDGVALFLVNEKSGSAKSSSSHRSYWLTRRRKVWSLARGNSLLVCGVNDGSMLCVRQHDSTLGQPKEFVYPFPLETGPITAVCWDGPGLVQFVGTRRGSVYALPSQRASREMLSLSLLYESSTSSACSCLTWNEADQELFLAFANGDLICYPWRQPCTSLSSHRTLLPCERLPKRSRIMSMKLMVDGVREEGALFASCANSTLVKFVRSGDGEWNFSSLAQIPKSAYHQQHEKGKVKNAETTGATRKERFPRGVVFALSPIEYENEKQYIVCGDSYGSIHVLENDDSVVATIFKVHGGERITDLRCEKLVSTAQATLFLARSIGRDGRLCESVIRIAKQQQMSRSERVQIHCRHVRPLIIGEKVAALESFLDRDGTLVAVLHDDSLRIFSLLLNSWLPLCVPGKGDQLMANLRAETAGFGSRGLQVRGTASTAEPLWRLHSTTSSDSGSSLCFSLSVLAVERGILLRKLALPVALHSVRGVGQRDLPFHSLRTNAGLILPVSRSLVSASEDGDIQITQLDTGHRAHCLRAPSLSAQVALDWVLSDDHSLLFLYSAGAMGSIACWKFLIIGSQSLVFVENAGSVVCKMQEAYRIWALKVLLGSSWQGMHERLLIAACSDGIVRMFEQSGLNIVELSAKNLGRGSILSLQLVVTSDGGELLVFCATSQGYLLALAVAMNSLDIEILDEFRVHNAGINRIAVRHPASQPSPSFVELLSAADDHSVRLCRYAHSEKKFERQNALVFHAHGASVRDVIWIDDDVFCSIGDDQVVCTWLRSSQSLRSCQRTCIADVSTILFDGESFFILGDGFEKLSFD